MTKAVRSQKSSYDEEICDHRLEAWPTQAERFSFYVNEKNCQQNLRERPHFKNWQVKITIKLTSKCYLYKQSWLMTLSHRRCRWGLWGFINKLSWLYETRENLVIRKIENFVFHSKPDISLLGSIWKASIDGFLYLCQKHSQLLLLYSDFLYELGWIFFGTLCFINLSKMEIYSGDDDVTDVDAVFNLFGE